MQKPINSKNDKNNAKPEIKKNNKKGTSLLLILVIIILTAIITFGSIFLFDIGGLKKQAARLLVNVPIVGNLVRPIAEVKSPEELQQDLLEAEKNDLKVKEEQLNEKEKTLMQKEKELSDKELALTAKELELTDLQEQLSTQLLGVQEQVTYLEKIEISKAVQILLNMDQKETVVQILRNMKKERASAILAAMDPLQAAQLLQDLKAPDESQTTTQTNTQTQ